MKKALLILSQILLPTLVLAGPPAKFPSCRNQMNIRTVPNGAGVYFDETCTTAYVLPPAKGKVEIAGIAPSSELARCAGYESSLKSLDVLRKQQQTLAKKIAQEESSDSDLEDTSLDGSRPQKEAEYKPVDSKLIEDYERILRLIESTEKALEASDRSAQGVAVAEIHYFNNWDQLLSDYRRANPKIHFERLPLDAGRIVFTRKTGIAGEGRSGSVSQNINGIGNTSGISADGTLQGTASGSVMMGDAISGQIVLNLAGACPFVKNGKLPERISASDISAYLAPNFQYRFSLMGVRKYSATFKLDSFFERVQKSRKSGGFFSTSTVNSIAQTNIYSDEFVIDIESDQLDFEYEKSLRTEVKGEMIMRVLQELAQAAGEKVNLPAQTPPPANGASVAAGELQKCPHLYCQIGGATLRILDSIFGNSSATASYSSSRNGRISEAVSEKKMFPYLGTTVFSGK